MVLYENIEVFVEHVTFLILQKLIMTIHPTKKAQIIILLTEKVTILGKYLDFSNIFLEKKALVLPELTKLNQYIIKLQKCYEPLYRPIYSLGLVELKTLKTHIMTILAKSFICLSK